MSDTPASLLDRLGTSPDPESWKRLVELYTPLIHAWLRRHSVQHQDADDVAQEVLAVVVRELPNFSHNQRPGTFRSWLRAITVNRLRELWRSKRHQPEVVGDTNFLAMLDQLEDPASGLSRAWDHEHDQHVVRKLLAFIEPEFKPQTWQAFHKLVFGGQKAAIVASELGMSTNAVFIAKSRVLRRFREELRGLTDQT